ncbi:MAG: RNA polymerase sigma factor [Actinobacteria bacterium]|jgi:RNA polymerase sigma-70 factor (ECF subfamily)|nr:RNA polymerase sigma factor [Actinomycetota bacterium]
MGWDLSKLVERAKEGDVTAFDELVKSTYKSTYHLALKLTGNVDDAFDVLQETYLRAFRSLKKFKADSSFPTWLYRITSNCASTLLASGKARSHDQLERADNVADTSREADIEEIASQAEERETIRTALLKLPNRLQVVVLLRDVYGFAHKEIADRLGISEAATKVRLHRGRLKLKEELGKLGKSHYDGSGPDAELPKAV